MNPEVPTNCFPAELVSRTGFLLGRLGMALKMQTMDAFEAEGFSAYQYSVLALLDEGPRTAQAAIADALQYDPSQLVAMLDGLEERGLIERRRDPSDRRRQMVSLTAAGKRQLAAFRKLVQRIEDEFLGPLDDDERRELHDLLLRVAERRDARYVIAAKASAS
ncbi:MAG TPA: MarR family transcriptional regulator [Gaiellaceae bacterium]|jgi:DNA-binding MarR family transcriptional regulator